MMNSHLRYGLATLIAVALSAVSYWMALHPICVYWTGMQGLSGMIGFGVIAGICAAAMLLPSVEGGVTRFVLRILSYKPKAVAFCKDFVKFLNSWTKQHEAGIVTKRNYFDYLRLLCCIGVVYGHSYNMTGNGGNDILLKLTGGTMDCATTGLLGFFTISGFLITSSFLADPHLGRFIWKRVLRIYPAFLVVAVICLYWIAPWSCDEVGRGQYLAWLHKSGVAGIGFRLLKLDMPQTPHTFPSTFAKSGIVNGPPWSLPVEFSLYLAVATLGIFGLLRRPKVVLALFACLLVMHALVTCSFPRWRHDLWYPQGPAAVVVPLWLAFMVGGMCRLFPRLRGWPVALIAACLWYECPTEFWKYLCWPLLIIWIGNKEAHPKLPKIRWDLSYGLYLVAWPLQQVFFSYFTHHSSVNFVCVMATGLPIAFLSWIVVERPALSLKGFRLPHIYKPATIGVEKELRVGEASPREEEHTVGVVI